MRVAILLAAGRSRRFVGGNKLLARQYGVEIVRQAVRAAQHAPVGRIIVGGAFHFGTDFGLARLTALRPRPRSC